MPLADVERTLDAVAVSMRREGGREGCGETEAEAGVDAEEGIVRESKTLATALS